MTLNSTPFEIVCFFSLGFLCLVGLIGFCLSLYFKSKIYYYYCGYILSVLVFIASVYCKSTHCIPVPSIANKILRLIIDFSQMLSVFMFIAFVFHAMILEDIKFKKLNILFQFYTTFTIIYGLIIFLFPRFVLDSIPYFIVTRFIIVVISLFFYYYIIKELKKIYFRFLFLAISFLLLSGFFAFWDSTFNYYSNEYVGFQYLCFGYILENICFSCAFIYKYFSTYSQKNEAEIRYELQLSEVQLEMKQQTMQHIGREIHDNVGQKLTLASLYTQQLAIDNQTNSVQSTIENIGSIINQSLAELRQLSKSLTCNVIDSNNLHELLLLECKRFNELKKCKIGFTATASIPDLAYQTKSVLLRISQEFIQNSIRHSDCENINIVLNYSNNRLHLCLKDDGKGFEITKKSNTGIGLIHMKKRAKIIGANFNFESVKDFGTKLTLELVI